MMPEGSENQDDRARGRLFFDTIMPTLKRMICTQKMTEYVRDEKKRDIAIFVAIFIDVVSGYFGVSIGTIILVQVYKIGVDRFCGTLDASAEPG